MKAFTVIMKILAAAAAVVGAIYIAATYGDKIVAWAKKMMAGCPCCCKDTEEEVVAEVEAEVEVAAEEPVAEEVAVEEVPAEEAPAEEAPVEEAEPVADEADFEG